LMSSVEPKRGTVRLLHYDVHFELRALS
jgi:hypothetical protein